ncbi:putative Cellulose-growth-specific protein [Glarea lozoyensis 74030]|uniref:AA9 family lytic polysaccharide monooxygenase n=1 Tax=Glarea lozoyensis (strain ATCC 74030 / MF5533) TaxID=1104152 RepID=H0EI42_GLAL7|nr:putative Cellulose-growth-specific protein [Glarea lozoyensis 74030]
MKFQDITSVLAFAGSALAHGGILSYTIDGKDYISNPYHLSDMTTNGAGDADIPDLTTPSIQRPYYWYPVEDVESSNMTCNYNAISNAPDFHATVPAGGNITAHWTSPEGGIFPYVGLSWRHSHGPMLAYLARCPGDSCANYKPEGAIWFKIAEAGMRPGEKDMTLNSAWWQSEINGYAGYDGEGYHYPAYPEGWSFNLPKRLKKGAYLIRHEIIMTAANPAQFYPNCAQLMVTGEGDKLPAAEVLVAFPGAYKASGK